jgi:CheY-like chemotaxis protein
MPAKKILIVEDESVVAKTVERYLKRLGYRVAGIVGNGEEALAVVAEARPDLALFPQSNSRRRNTELFGQLWLS